MNRSYEKKDWTRGYNFHLVESRVLVFSYSGSLQFIDLTEHCCSEYPVVPLTKKLQQGGDSTLSILTLSGSL